MANNVFANGREIACKKGAGKSICAFPDVVWTPPDKVPPTPTGVPVPYPNTAMASDTSKGTKKVRISGQEAMLKNSSNFKKSTGDEAGVAQLKGIMTRKQGGKVYFQMWSMDVKFEGKNVVRHLDIATHNHGSQVGNTPPWPFFDEMTMTALEAWAEAHDHCQCCGGEKHSQGEIVDMKTWYTTNNLGNPLPSNEAEYDSLMELVANRKQYGCTCNPPTRVVPAPPCNVFYNKTTTAERNQIKERYNDAKAAGYGQGSFNATIGRSPGQQGNHLVPKSAGGCPDNPGNVQAHEKLCDACKYIDKQFTELQNSSGNPPIP